MNAAVDIYKQHLPKPKGQIVYPNSIGANNLIQKIKQRKQESTKLKMAGAASLQRESNCTSELGLIGGGISNIPNSISQTNNVQVNQSLIGKNLNNMNVSPSNHIVNQQQFNNKNQILLTSSRNGQGSHTNNNISTNQGANFIQANKLIRDQSRNQIEKRQSISFDRQQKQIESIILQKNPYIASKKAAKIKGYSNQKHKDKSYSILTNNSNIKQKFGYDVNPPKNNSQKPSPRNSYPNIGGVNIIGHDQSLNHGLQKILENSNFKSNQERSLERNNSVFSRKELIKKEYTKIIENRLPNILNLMNHDKQSMGIVSELNENLDYDDTELLSKLFAKDQNKSGILQMYELQATLQSKNDKARYQYKENNKQYQPTHPEQLSSSHSQDRIYGQSSESDRKSSSLDYKKAMILAQANSLNIKSNGHPSIIDQVIKDEDIIKLDRLQLINASARYELLSANQQLLDFHLSRIMNSKYKKKKVFQNAGEKSIHQVYDDINSNVVCEDIDNESDGGNSTLCYEDKNDKNRERIRQLADPHSIMHEQNFIFVNQYSRLNSMNPLMFGDTIRLPMLNIIEHGKK